jgi:hypothetical protein
MRPAAGAGPREKQLGDEIVFGLESLADLIHGWNHVLGDQIFRRHALSERLFRQCQSGWRVSVNDRVVKLCVICHLRVPPQNLPERPGQVQQDAGSGDESPRAKSRIIRTLGITFSFHWNKLKLVCRDYIPAGEAFAS